MGGDLLDKVGEVSGPTSQTTDIGEDLAKLKADFSLACEKKCSNEGLSRIVIFVDDLDRIRPAHAIEMLEALKIFTDVKRCVFVLALDFNVVKRGLKDKFGLSSDDLDGRSFFDKIIQLPFNVPIASYNISSYLKDLLTRIGFDCDESQLPIYADLLTHSIGTNPRSTKRLINILKLMDIVFYIDRDAEEEVANSFPKHAREQVLFALVCIQNAYHPLYNFLQQSAKKSDNKFSKILTYLGDIDVDSAIGENENQSLIIEVVQNIPDYEIKAQRIVSFLKAFLTTIDVNRDGSFSTHELALLRKLLGNLAITNIEEADTRAPDGGIKNDNITKICRNAARTFAKSLTLDLDMTAKYARQISRSKKNRSFDFTYGSIEYRVELYGDDKGRGFAERDHEVHVAAKIYTPEINKLRGGKKQKEAFEELSAHIHGSISEDWGQDWKQRDGIWLDQHWDNRKLDDQFSDDVAQIWLDAKKVFEKAIAEVFSA